MPEPDPEVARGADPDAVAGPDDRSGPSPRASQERIGQRDLTDWPTAAGRLLVSVVEAVTGPLAGLARWSRANVALVVTVVVGGVVVLVLDLLAAAVYDAVSEGEGLQTLDRPVLDAAVRMRTPTSVALVNAYTHLGGTVGMTCIALVLTAALALSRRSWTPVVLMAVAGAGSVVLTLVGKDLVGRARPPAALAVPPLESSPSFPSGHTLNSTVLVGMAAYLVLLGVTRLWLRVLVVSAATLFVLGMGLSRVFLGHHWLTDVVAGWLIGLGWLAAVVTGHRIQLTLRRSDEARRTARAERARAVEGPGQPVARAARPASSRATGTRNGEHDT